jgi:hypothetical protein
MPRVPVMTPNRIATLTLASLLSLPLAACDRVRDERRAEGVANMQARQTQTEPDPRVAVAWVDFEAECDAYRGSRESGMAALDGRISDLDERAKTATGPDKLDLDQKLRTIRSQRDAFVFDMRNVDSATPVTWEATRTELDREWSALERSVNQL